MQLRLECQLTAEQYVLQRFWEQASLPPCPAHPEGGCGFCWHTGYERKHPPGTWIARGYCRTAHLTVGLIPDCLASRLSATLEELEAVVDLVEQRTGSLATLANELRPAVGADDDHVTGTIRWLRRRYLPITVALVTIAGLMPSRFAGHPQTLPGFRAALGIDQVLVALRGTAADYLANLPPPLGFGPRTVRVERAAGALQQRLGSDQLSGAG